jgi:hypothetical protein
MRCIINIIHIADSVRSRVVHSVKLPVRNSRLIPDRCRVFSMTVWPNQPPINRLPIALLSGVKRQEREDQHSPSCNAKVNDACICTITPPCIFIVMSNLLQHTGYSLYGIAFIGINNYISTHTHTHTFCISIFFVKFLK